MEKFFNSFGLSEQQIAEVIEVTPDNVIESMHMLGQTKTMHNKQRYDYDSIRKYFSHLLGGEIKLDDETIAILIANHKGGVGKTTQALNLAMTAHCLGAKVLVLDMDPQSNLTNIFLDWHKDRKIYSAFEEVTAGMKKIEECVIPIAEDLHLLPSSRSLNTVKKLLYQEGGEELKYVFAKELNRIKQDYDFIFIDSGPTLDALNYSLLHITDLIICPVQYGKMELDGISELYNEYEAAVEGEGISFNSKKFRVLFNMTKKKSRLEKSMHDSLDDSIKDLMFETKILSTSKIREAVNNELPVWAYRGWKDGTTFSYFNLLFEMIGHCSKFKSDILVKEAESDASIAHLLEF